MSEGLTYDTGALVAAERNDRLVWSLHRAALRRGLPPTVPAGVLAEGWRGGPQANLSRLLQGCDIEDLTKAQARAVGAAAARARRRQAPPLLSRPGDRRMSRPRPVGSQYTRPSRCDGRYCWAAQPPGTA